MSSTSNRARALAALACGVLLAACDDAPEQQTRTGPTTPQAASRAAGLPPEMVAAVSPGKSASVISVHFALRGVPTVGKPLPVDIAVVPHVPFESVRVTFEARDGVTLGENRTMGPALNVPSEKAISRQIVFEPVREGMFVVTATVDTEGAEGSVTRVFFIPLIIEAAASAPPPAPAQPIPAQESAPAATPATDVP